MPVSETALENESQLIADAKEMREILDRPVMRKVLERMRDRYLAEWKAGKGVADREKAHSKYEVLDDFAQQCVVVIDAGTRATLERQKREEREQRASAPKTRAR